MAEKKWVVSLDSVCKTDTRLVGGKCANLGEMIKLGVRVPPGFAVTTEAYNFFLDETGAGEEINLYLREFPEVPKGLAEMDEVSQAIRGIIISREIPKAVQKAICHEYEGLCKSCGIVNLPVAVRSSGVAEDMPTASFAGQYDSYLNVRGEEDLLENVRLCWSSAFNMRCISYRIQNKLEVLGGSISTAVQKMVNSRAAGVGFTIHPVTGDDTRIILEGNWGVGESVVQGVVSPDIFVIDKETLTLEDKEISTKLRQYSFKTTGTEEEDVPLEKQGLACIGDEEAIKIAEFARFVELQYGLPIDIEWAVDSDLLFPDSVFLVQARPVTVIVQKKNVSEHILDQMINRLHR